ncbi:hypothetical protein F6A13_03575 [Acidithiobacillus sp. 'AMD consortium']|uniref:hypothetical protein n=1 Tax=Acidithiobacillus sp. 'AMD consortium' TaxID=2614801 RepID=UPI00124C24D7|nr:hypothetical protein [Acidithiobacillus sp. 'AMD consortium']QFG77816.1 hypothetical protein F6A13_03575 [Acidithiobacillus sp. 'AMD consortium']
MSKLKRKNILTIALACALVTFASQAVAGNIGGMFKGSQNSGTGIGSTTFASGEGWLMSSGRLAPGPIVRDYLKHALYSPDMPRPTPQYDCARFSTLQALEPFIYGGDPFLYGGADGNVTEQRNDAIWIPEIASLSMTNPLSPAEELLFFGGFQGVFHAPDIIIAEQAGMQMKPAIVTELVHQNGSAIVGQPAGISPGMPRMDSGLFRVYWMNPDMIGIFTNYNTFLRLHAAANNIAGEQQNNVAANIPFGTPWTSLGDFLKEVSNIMTARWAPIPSYIMRTPAHYLPPVGTYNRFTSSQCSYQATQSKYVCKQIAAWGQNGTVKLPWMNSEDMSQVQNMVESNHPSVVYACYTIKPYRRHRSYGMDQFLGASPTFGKVSGPVGKVMVYGVSPRLAQRMILRAHASGPAAVARYVLNKQVETMYTQPLKPGKWLMELVPNGGYYPPTSNPSTGG